MLLWGGGSNCQSPAQQNIYASVTWQRCGRAQPRRCSEIATYAAKVEVGMDVPTGGTNVGGVSCRAHFVCWWRALKDVMPKEESLNDRR